MSEIPNVPSGEAFEQEEAESLGDLVLALVSTAEDKDMPITTMDITGPITVKGKGNFGLHINPAKVYGDGKLKTFAMDLYDAGDHSCQWIAEVSWDEEGYLDWVDITTDPIIGKIKLTITEVSIAAVKMIENSEIEEKASEIPNGMIFPFPTEIIHPTRPN